MADVSSTVPHPAATLVLLRDTAHGCEALLLRRSPQLSFHGGAWVFPGGRVDRADYVAAGGTTDPIGAARHAAVRETSEEAGVVIAADRLVAFSRWLTPEGLPKRFDAWFFAARAENDAVQVDGREIHEHRWLRPYDALLAHHAGEIELPPPTWVTLHRLSGYRAADEVLAAAALGPTEFFVPRLHVVADGACTLYAGDVAYDNGDLSQAGPRHRLWMIESGWRYERT